MLILDGPAGTSAGTLEIARVADRIAVVELIGATTTTAGVKVDCVLGERTFVNGIKIRNVEMDACDITGDVFHPEWNYTIAPRHAAKS